MLYEEPNHLVNLMATKATKVRRFEVDRTFPTIGANEDRLRDSYEPGDFLFRLKQKFLCDGFRCRVSPIRADLFLSCEELSEVGVGSLEGFAFRCLVHAMRDSMVSCH